MAIDYTLTFSLCSSNFRPAAGLLATWGAVSVFRREEETQQFISFFPVESNSLFHPSWALKARWHPHTGTW